MRYLLIALTLTSTAAWSQTAFQFTLSSGETELRIKGTDCDLTRTVTWSHAITTTVCDDLKFWIAESCSDEPPTSGATLLPDATVKKANVLTTTSGSVTFDVSQLPIFASGGATCPDTGKEHAYKLCGSVPIAGGLTGDCSSGSKNYQKDDVDVVYDAEAPAAPSITKVSARDEALAVTVSVGTDASQVHFHAVRADGTDPHDHTQSADDSDYTFEGLENDVTYRVTATALDVVGNESAESEAKEGTPIPTLGFFDRYVEAQGQETGGCGVATGDLMGGGILAVLGLWLSSRRKRS